MALSAKALLNTTRRKKDGTFPIIVRVIYNRKPYKIPTGYYVTPEHWDDENQVIKKSFKDISNVGRANKLIQEKKTEAIDKILKLEDSGEINSLSSVELRGILAGKKEEQGVRTVFQYIDQLIDELNEAKKYGNADVYKTLRNKLKSFVGHEYLFFEHIDYRFLKKLETSHYANGNSPGGLSVYMRSLRAVVNRAIKEGILSKENYAFENYQIKNGKPTRKAMSERDFEIFRNAEFEKGTSHYKAHKLFMASFYMRGMNWTDMALLRVRNIQDQFTRIVYIRQKTGEPFNIKISPMLKEIMVELMDGRFDLDDFVFPILSEDEQPEDYTRLIRFRRQNLNKRYKEIAELLKIEPFTIYTARHTYATTGKRKGVPIAVIQDSLGHSTEKMTQNYLSSFENEVVDGFDELIMS
jgi:integrase